MRLAAAGLLVAVIALGLLGDLVAHHTAYAVIAVCSTLVLYAAALRTGGRVLDGRHVLFVAIALRLAALPMQPSLSDDAWRYLWDGWMGLNGVNPYVVAPSDPTLDWARGELYALQGHPETPTVYPPAAQVLFMLAAVPLTLDASPLAAYFSLKAILVAIDMGAVLLLMRLLDALGRPRAWAVLYAWHPLVVVEIAGQGHSDGLWAASILLALTAAARSIPHRGVPWLVLGGMLRLHPLALLPLWARTLEPRALGCAVLVSAPLLLLALPLLFDGALGTFLEVAARFTNYYEFNGGFYYAVKRIVDELALSPSNRIAGAVSVCAQVGIIVAAALRVGRGDGVGRLVAISLVVTTATVALGAKAHVWYFVAPLVLVALDPRAALSRAWLWLALVAPLTYSAYTSTPVRESSIVLWLEWGGAAALALWSWRKRDAVEATTREPERSDRVIAERVG
jgi:alpha-1,6-mannosyltransferase